MGRLPLLVLVLHLAVLLDGGQAVGSKQWRRRRRHVTARAAVPAPAAESGGCSFSGAWTDGSSENPICEAGGIDNCDGAQFWLTDTAAGFRGVSHGPADFVHAGNGPYQMGWSHCNASYVDREQCKNRGPASCNVVGTHTCMPDPKPGDNVSWSVRHDTRAINFPPLKDWVNVQSVSDCEAKCAATHGCEAWTYVWKSPAWPLTGGCWAYPRAAKSSFTPAANWTSGVLVAASIDQSACTQLGCCWHPEGSADLRCVKPETLPCEVCVTLDADAPARTLSTSCSSPPPGSYTNSSDWSEMTCASCGTLAEDCSSIEWQTGPLSRNSTTKSWKREQLIHTVHLVFSTHFDVGCAWNVHTVMDLFFHRYIPEILAVQVRDS